MCVCVCVRALCVCFPFVWVCVCIILVLFNVALNLCMKFFLLFEIMLVWYIGTICLSWLHLYGCLDTSNFRIFGMLVLLLWSEILVLRACVDPMKIYIYNSRFCRLRFWSQLKSLFILNVRTFKGIGFSFWNYITYFTSFILAFGNSLYCVLPECRRDEYSFKYFCVVSSS